MYGKLCKLKCNKGVPLPAWLFFLICVLGDLSAIWYHNRQRDLGWERSGWFSSNDGMLGNNTRNELALFYFLGGRLARRQYSRSLLVG